jgi:malonyl-ACP O-methyltransferase BioC
MDESHCRGKCARRRGIDVSGVSGIEAVDKSALARQFSAAADHYDEWATAQAEIAAQLAARLPGHLAPALMVELGCGTGLLSVHLRERFPQAALIGIDLAGGMVEHCRRRFAASAGSANVRFVTGDVEDRRMLVPDAELIASSCVAQWFGDLAATLRMWSQALAPAGTMAFACLLQGSFCELEQCYFEALGRRFAGLSLPGADALPQMFAACGLRVAACVQGSVRARYGSARAALRSFQEIGADFHGQPGHRALGPAALRQLLASYDGYADAQGMVPVTYRVQYVIAERHR